MASLGLGCLAVGSILLCNSDKVGAALTGGLGSVGGIIPALPGLLVFCGTALLGLALIRHAG